MGMPAISFRFPRRRRRKLRPDLATQWQLTWWRFRRHQLALVGLVLLSALILSAIFAGFVGPYNADSRNRDYLGGAPMIPHFVDAEGDFHLRPFVYARSAARNPITLRLEYELDTAERWPVRFFVRGDRYKFWGLVPTDIHLFGAEGGFIHLFGTDTTGLDLFSRTMHATRISLSVGLVGVFFAFVIGAILGGVAGYFGGAVDNIVMRLIEFIRSIPTLPLWLALASTLPRHWSPLQTYLAITVILALLGWTWLARTVRSKLLSTRKEDFVLAARLSGCTHRRVIFRHLLPSFLSYLIVDVSIAFPEILLAETSLSFLGLGLREPVESWGVLLSGAQNVQAIAHTPWLMIPGLFVIIAVLAFNFLGDGLRDAADPYSN
jgi:peptide/nickel transport system permease protein